jgi:hypothetical protein
MNVQRPTTDRKLNAYLERKERKRLDVFVNALRAVMETPEGRFVVWHWLDRAGINRSVWDASGMQVHFNAGQQEFGFAMKADVNAAGHDLFELMNRELREWEARVENELAAREQQSRDAAKGEQ